MMMNTVVERIRGLLLGDAGHHARKHGETSRLIEEACKTVESARQERDRLQNDLQRYQDADVARTLLLARDRNEA